jgi:ubiquinone/menaquinone biosynthesis C-methylase UbiE
VATSLAQKVIEANIAVHSRLAAHYQSCEPHFRPENAAKVGQRIATLARETQAESLLDLGCGTGFIINLAKPLVRRITGVDVTQAMLDRVDRSGPASIELVNQDTGAYPAAAGAFQLVTAYSFVHHLAEVGPTFRTASRALAPGGKFYADLEPNFYFWQDISRLERGGDYDPVVRREIESVAFKDEEIEGKFGVSREIFNHAEFGKDIAGGFREEMLRQQLQEAGFTRVEFHYHWFLGEGVLINGGTAPREELFRQAATIHEALRRALPVSRNLFKYLGFVATK